jgi:hypothetical protein
MLAPRVTGCCRPLHGKIDQEGHEARFAFPALRKKKEGRKSLADQGRAPQHDLHRVRLCDTCEEHKMKINKVVRSNLARLQR